MKSHNKIIEMAFVEVCCLCVCKRSCAPHVCVFVCVWEVLPNFLKHFLPPLRLNEFWSNARWKSDLGNFKGDKIARFSFFSPPAPPFVEKTISLYKREHNIDQLKKRPSLFHFIIYFIFLRCFSLSLSLFYYIPHICLELNVIAIRKQGSRLQWSMIVEHGSKSMPWLMDRNFIPFFIRWCVEL